MRVSNIPIRDNRNGNTLLNCPNAVVFRVAVKQTGAGSAVNRQGLNTTVFGQLGNLYTVTMLWRPAGANLQRYRHIHRVNHRVEDPFYQIRVLQQGGPGKLPVHFLAGHPILMSMIRAPLATLIRAAAAISSGSHPAICTERILVHRYAPYADATYPSATPPGWRRAFRIQPSQHPLHDRGF